MLYAHKVLKKEQDNIIIFFMQRTCSQFRLLKAFYMNA